jgi:general secretion pathway protein D
VRLCNSISMRRVAVLGSVILCVGGCSQLAQLASSKPPSSTQSSSSSSNDVLATFGDLLGGGHSSTAGSGGNPRPADGSGANTQPVIYSGDGVSHPAIAVGEAGSSTAKDSRSGVTPAAYVVAEGTPGVAAAEGGKIQVTFENADINSVIHAILGETLKLNYTVDPRVHGNVSLSTGRPVSHTQLLWLLETALRPQGVVVVNQDGVYRVLPATETNGVGSANIGPDAGTPGYGITALPLENISAENLNKILDGFGATPGSVHVDSARNLLIVRGSTSERQWLIDTALAFDVNWMRNQSIGIFPIKNSSPEVVINELNQLADPALVKFQSISRLNAILAISRNTQTVRQVQTWIARLDRQSDFGPRAHIFRLKSADARKVVSILKEVYGAGGSGATGSDQVAPGGPAAIAKAPGASTQTPSADSSKSDANSSARADGLGGGGAGGGGAGFGGAGDNAAGGSKLRITADVPGNSVIVFSNQEDYKSIERTILELDRPAPEVMIEAIAAEVTLNDNLTYGVQYFLQSSSAAATGSISQLSAALPITQTVPGLNLLLGSQSSPKVVINALRDVTDVKILSSPSLVVADSQAAVLQVGDQVPVTTGTATSTVTTQSAIVNSVSYVDTGVILRVTPHISRMGTVRLDIEQEVSAVEQNANAATLTPTISQQKVKSTIDIDSGQTVLLAGLISQQRNMEKTGIPGVIDLPIVGNILSNSTNSAKRQELIIFVKAQVVHNNLDAQHVSQELRRRMPGFNSW